MKFKELLAEQQDSEGSSGDNPYGHLTDEELEELAYGPLGSAVGGAIRDAISRGIEKIQPHLEPMKDYYERMKDKAQQEADRLRGQAEYAQQRLSGPEAMGNIASDLSNILRPSVTAYQDKIKSIKTKGFFGDYIKNTEKQLAATKIPPSPKANIGKPAGLKQRKYTKGFYG